MESVAHLRRIIVQILLKFLIFDIVWSFLTEVEVPAPIYETLRFYNSESSASSGMDTTSSRGSRHSGLERANTDGFGAKTRTLTSRIKSLFGKT